MNIVNELVP